MQTPRFTIALIALVGPAAAAVPPSTAVQVAGAVAPAPESQQSGATVLGYDAEGALVPLREGEGDLVCLADDPADERFHAACYHRDLEPFMARGRALGAEGLDREARRAQRKAEIEAGTLAFPREPRALYSLTGPLEVFNPETGAVTGANRVFVIYIPWATEASTGLSTTAPSPGAPWIMDPGEPWAHIMVVPPTAE